MFWLRKILVADWIAELAPIQREKTRRVHRILTKIELYWNSYPLYGAAVAVLGFMLLNSFGIGQTSVFGIGPWWAVAIFVTVYSLTKLALLPRCKRHLGELEDELSTDSGSRAGEIIDRWDRRLLCVAKRAGRRNLRSWFF